jgi:hypothetical protein
MHINGNTVLKDTVYWGGVLKLGTDNNAMWVVVSSGPTEGRIKEEFLEILKHGADVE